MNKSSVFYCVVSAKFFLLMVVYMFSSQRQFVEVHSAWTHAPVNKLWCDAMLPCGKWWWSLSNRLTFFSKTKIHCLTFSFGWLLNLFKSFITLSIFLLFFVRRWSKVITDFLIIKFSQMTTCVSLKGPFWWDFLTLLSLFMLIINYRVPQFFGEPKIFFTSHD